MNKLPKISEAEWRVMRVFWANPQATTNEVVETLTPVTPWKPKTIMTLLKRLVDKGALGFEKKGRIYEYYPLAQEAECIREASRSFLQRVHGGALKPMLSHFLEEAALSKEDIDELKHILEKRGK
jgi:BlaI family penicillinase repressor